MNWPHGDPDGVARAILAEPLFRSALASTDVKPQPTLLAIAWDWFVQHVARPFLTPLIGAVAAAHAAGTIAGIALVVVALAGVAFVCARLAFAFAARSPKRGTEGVARDGLPEHSRAAAHWRRIASTAAASGEYARAIAALWAAALARLDERGVVTLDAARTPDEYRRLVEGCRVEVRVPFERLSERFVRAAYSATPAARHDFEIAEGALRELEPAL